MEVHHTSHTQLIKTIFGKCVFGSSTRQTAYIILPSLSSSTISSKPSSREIEMLNQFSISAKVFQIRTITKLSVIKRDLLSQTSIKLKLG